MVSGGSPMKPTVVIRLVAHHRPRGKLSTVRVSIAAAAAADTTTTRTDEIMTGTSHAEVSVSFRVPRTRRFIGAPSGSTGRPTCHQRR